MVSVFVLCLVALPLVLLLCDLIARGGRVPVDPTAGKPAERPR